MGVQDRKVRKLAPNANLEMAFKKLRKDLGQASVKGERGVGARYESCCGAGWSGAPYGMCGIFLCRRTPHTFTRSITIGHYTPSRLCSSIICVFHVLTSGSCEQFHHECVSYLSHTHLYIYSYTTRTHAGTAYMKLCRG